MDERTSIDAPPPIPGERDPGTLTHFEVGTMGGGAFGERIPSPVHPLDEVIARELERDGGGAESERGR